MPSSPSSSVYLWPRQELLQLILPQFSLSNRGPLTVSTAVDALKNLSQSQADDGKISFDRWFLVAKTFFKWNDSCIKLFWDILNAALSYIYQSDTSSAADEENSIEFVYLSIFLVLHINDTPRPQSPTTFYDSVWPPLNDGEYNAPPLSPLGSSSSMKRIPNLSPKSPASPISSPRSINHKRNNIPTSPRHSKSSAQYLQSIKQKLPLILSIIAEDGRLIDDLISSSKDSIDGEFVDGNSDSGFQKSRRPNMLKLNECGVTLRNINSLRFLFGGGKNREEEVMVLSSLHPLWNTSPQVSTSFDNMDEQLTLTVPISEALAWFESHLSINETLYPTAMSPVQVNSTAGSNSNTSNNAGNTQTNNINRDTNSKSFFPSRKFTELGEDQINPNVFLNGFEDKQVSPYGHQQHQHQYQHPERILTSTSSLSRATPVILNGCSQTYMFVATSGSVRRSQSKPFEPADVHSAQLCDMLERQGISEMATTTVTSSTSSSSDALDKMQMQMQMQESSASGGGSDNGDAMSDGGSNGGDQDRDRDHLAAQERDDMELVGKEKEQRRSSSTMSVDQLPTATVSHCSNCPVYLLSSFLSGSVVNCRDVDIVIGAVYGVVTVSNCERLRITVACRALIVQNCLDCHFHLATLQPTIISGDSRNLSFGPFNTSYRRLKQHLALCKLNTLTHSSTIESDDAVDFQVVGSSPANQWANLCDMNACVDSSAAPAAGSPSGYAIDALGGGHVNRLSGIPLPFPAASMAVIEPQDKFTFINIPSKQDFLDIDACVIPLPKMYLSEAVRQRTTVAEIQHRLLNTLNSELTTVPPYHDIGVSDNAASSSPSAALLNQAFMEWLLQTGRGRELLDLVKLDLEASRMT